MRASKQQPSSLSSSGPTRWELAVLACIVLLGIVLRLIAFSRAAVEHFDEGVYASNLYFGPPEYAYPQQRFFGPPLLPALIETGMIAGLPPNVAALLPGVFAGCATIAILWWFGRSWFGPETGIAAAALVSLSGFHAAFSATALTDVLLSLWLVLAIDAIARSFLNGDFRWAVGAGIYTGLAWWTKYNGWLPLAIEAAALPLLWLAIRPTRKELVNWLLCFGITALIAAAVWTPYYLSLESQGGYAPIAANHAKYFVGFSGWLDAARRQAVAMAAFESPLDKFSFGLACAAAAFVVPNHTRRWHSIIWAGCVASASLFLTSAALLTVIASVRICAWAMRSYRTSPGDLAARRTSVAGCCMIVWFAGLFLATPLYTPYPRLMLPWLLGMWLAAGWGAGSTADFAALHDRFLQSKRTRIAVLATIAVAGIVIALLRPGRARWEVGTWDFLSNRRSLLAIAAKIHEPIGSAPPRVMYVYGEPAMLFQLKAGGEEIVAPVEDVPQDAARIDGQPVPTFLITGPHAQRDPRFQVQWATAGKHWRLVQAFDYVPSPIVWLDLHDPREKPPRENHVVHLYQLER